MKANINMNASSLVVKAGEFSFVRKPRTLKAYGQTFEIPVKTVEFSDRLDAMRAEIGRTAITSDTVRALRKGIALFIGEENVEKIYPKDKLDSLDPDEILGFWTALNYELNRTQRELISQYSR